MKIDNETNSHEDDDECFEEVLHFFGNSRFDNERTVRERQTTTTKGLCSDSLYTQTHAMIETQEFSSGLLAT